MKMCTRCGLDKTTDEFKKSKQRKDGLSSWCKLCNNEVNKTFYSRDPLSKEKQRKKNKLFKLRNPELYKKLNRKSCVNYANRHPDRISEQKKKYYLEKIKGKIDDDGRKKIRDAVLRWRHRNLDKCECTLKVRYAIASGKLVRPNICSICYKISKPIHAHHHDYSKPLDIIWCCRSCHGRLDRIRRKQELFNKKEQHG